METFLSQSFIYSIVYILKHGCLVADKNEVTKDLEWADSILSAFRWCERQEPPWSFMIHLVKFPATCMVVFGVISANRQFAENTGGSRQLRSYLIYYDLDGKLKFASNILIILSTTIFMSLVHFLSHGPKTWGYTCIHMWEGVWLWKVVFIPSINILSLLGSYSYSWDRIPVRTVKDLLFYKNQSQWEARKHIMWIRANNCDQMLNKKYSKDICSGQSADAHSCAFWT